MKHISYLILIILFNNGFLKSGDINSAIHISEKDVYPTNNISINQIISFNKYETGKIEEILILNDWILKDNQKKEYKITSKTGFGIHTIIYKNKFSDSEIVILQRTGAFKDRDITFKTSSTENYKELLLQLKNNNFILKDSDYQMGQKSYVLIDPKVGEKSLINNSARLYTNGKNKVTINIGFYVTINEVLHDSEGNYTGTYYHSESSKTNGYEIDVD